MGGKSGGGGKGTQTVVTRNEPSEFLKPFLELGLGRSKKLFRQQSSKKNPFLTTPPLPPKIISETFQNPNVAPFLSLVPPEVSADLLNQLLGAGPNQTSIPSRPSLPGTLPPAPQALSVAPTFQPSPPPQRPRAGGDVLLQTPTTQTGDLEALRKLVAQFLASGG